jgi:nucleoside-diphosphate-sugar epimerase
MGVEQAGVEDVVRDGRDAHVNVLLTGNMGYVGPVAVRHLRAALPDARLTGLDLGYFAGSLTTAGPFPERLLDRQLFLDVRDVPPRMLEGVDAIVHLAAISNDPIGNAFEEVTAAVNHGATVELARRARDEGVRSFVFASSCSMYGFAEDGLRTEESTVAPLTAYSRSKAAAEADLTALADDGFAVTCLRFGTACGMSDRLRLDLVLNDFVAAAIADRRILILSDGTPWRPLVDVRDMARAIEWGLTRDLELGSDVVVNVGRDDWNFQVRQLAEAVAAAVPGTDVEITADAPPDRRSYRVGFDRYAALAPDHQPLASLEETVKSLVEGLQAIGFADPDFRSSDLVRLNVLARLQRDGALTADLAWADTGAARAGVGA